MLHSQACPILHQNKPSRESFFCGKVGGWCTERALIMLNFSPKIRQIYLCCIHLHGQLDGKHVRLRPPARAVAGHAAHAQRRRYHGNEKQSATDSRFSTCRDSIECFPPGRSLRHKHLVLTTLLPYYLLPNRFADLNIAQLRLFCYFCIHNYLPTICLYDTNVSTNTHTDT